MDRKIRIAHELLVILAYALAVTVLWAVSGVSPVEALGNTYAYAINVWDSVANLFSPWG